MINLSSYQGAIYKELELLGYNVYDDVTDTAKMPFIVIGDIDFQEGQTHFKDILDISQSIEIWSDWEGKKEVNDIASDVINKLYSLNEKKINDSQSIYNISLSPSTIKRVEGYYSANLNINFTIKND